MKRNLLHFLLIFPWINLFSQLPQGYYDTTAGLSGAPLKTELSQIITNGHQDHGYGGLWIAYQTTDRDYFYENDGTILDIYSENPIGPDPYNFNYGTNQCGTYSNEGDCYNREHIVPQSLFNEAFPMKSDLHFIRPTDGKVNAMRSNYPFGKVGTATYTSQNGSRLGNSISSGYSGTVFEPIDEFKGDIARMILYFATRYENKLSTFSTGNMLGGSAFPGLQIWELNQLLAWHNLDPVSTVEIARNNASYQYQGNRNPFIDHPEYVEEIWGNLIDDTEPPTPATDLLTTGATSNSISLSWTAATDNIGVTAYDIYTNGTLKTTISGTTITISGLAPSTTYSFYVIAKDAAGNSSPQSNTTTGSTLPSQSGENTSCGSENFESIPTISSSSYLIRNWTNNNISWAATDARTDQTINGKAITIRNGNVTSTTISDGIESLTLTTQLKYSGTPGTLNVEINGISVGTIPYSSNVSTTTINNIHIAGNIIIKIINSNSNRIALDDLSWTCYSSVLKTLETNKDKLLSISPNPIKNDELVVKGRNLNTIYKAEIYDLSGKLIQKFTHPFKYSNKLNVKGISTGTYIFTTNMGSIKFIVE
ncbi:endonuclease [Chryseobacterium potabilaquae]|uniref:Extracellular ribonuclease n=1 Tax=Chryseobacterium potabilaquae TaxID=2675057 RepID=A0A6N4X592_9FLAO|nr:endonuclease [Chryseobacterium potabilaquae]CAA7196171.1 Extracellular ribonuclease [Chryseobacterium potabilaquae]